jgi:hypothetical protein
MPEPTLTAGFLETRLVKPTMAMAVRERIARAKYEPEDRLDTVKAIKDDIDKEIETMIGATVE